MKKGVIILILLVYAVHGVGAWPGCCSWHDGVCGCSCCDGTPLSDKCLPHYPECASITTTTILSEASCDGTITTDTTLTEDILNCDDYGISVGEDDLVLDCNGHTISGNNSSGMGILVANHNNITIKNCIVRGFYYGVYLYYSNGNNLTNNTVNNNLEEGIHLYESDNNILVDVTSINNPLGGIVVRYSDNNFLSDIIAGYTNDRFAIHLDHSSNNNLTGIQSSNDNNDGVYLEHSSDNILTDITATNNDMGISLQYSNDNLITHSTITNNNFDGIYLYSSSNNTFTDVNVTNNQGGTYSAGINILSNSDNNTLTNVIACNNTDHDIDDECTSNTGEGNTCDSVDNWNDDKVDSGCTYNCAGQSMTTSTTSTTSTTTTSTTSTTHPHYLTVHVGGLVLAEAHWVVLITSWLMTALERHPVMAQM